MRWISSFFPSYLILIIAQFIQNKVILADSFIRNYFAPECFFKNHTQKKQIIKHAEISWFILLKKKVAT